MSMVIVDWLGRGGIAQCTQAWAVETARHNRCEGAVTIVTRSGRELQPVEGVTVLGVAGSRHPALTHRRLIRAATETIYRVRPRTVVIQNYVAPLAEWPVARTALATGARLVVVVHDHQLHRGTTGFGAGLRRLVASADIVVCHSAFVAAGTAALSGRTDISVTPLPLPGPLPVDYPGPSSASADVVPHVAIHFGMVAKAYKGAETVLRLARRGVPQWEFALVGSGAPQSSLDARVVPGFLPADDLISEVRASRATLLPYSFATQSGAVALAQGCGSLVVAHPVGGIPEQVAHGVTGLLVAPGSPDRAWMDALEEAADPVRHLTMTGTARAGIQSAQLEFARFVQDLAA